MHSTQLRIGELSRRVGVSPELLRAWERRYGLLRPTRTSGGFRLYSEDDVARVQRMQQLLDEGIAAAEAAQLADATTEQATIPDGPVLDQFGAALTRALDAFDEVNAHWLLDRTLGAFQLEAVLSDLVLPYLHDLGERWGRGDVTVGQEHFASTLIRARLLALGQGWDRGSGPRALLACPPDELHDLPLVVFGLALRQHGWRITLLGASTPIDTLSATADALTPDLVVLAASEPVRLVDAEAEIAALAKRWPVALGGAGADHELAERLSARMLEGDPVSAARAVAGLEPAILP